MVAKAARRMAVEVVSGVLGGLRGGGLPLVLCLLVTSTSLSVLSQLILDMVRDRVGWLGEGVGECRGGESERVVVWI